MAFYIDSSALVKLVVPEAESTALRRFLGRDLKPLSCALARVEVVRAVWPQGAATVGTARELLMRLDLLALDDDLLDAAGVVEGRLRSPDAIHLAAARSLGIELEALITYDDRLAAAASAAGLPVAAPRPGRLKARKTGIDSRASRVESERSARS